MDALRPDADPGHDHRAGAVNASHGKGKKGKERKPWREMRPGEISQIKAMKCRRCVYAAGTKMTGEGFTSIICDYIGYTGRMRGCDPRDCEYWRDEKPRGKRQSDW